MSRKTKLIVAIVSALIACMCLQLFLGSSVTVSGAKVVYWCSAYDSIEAQAEDVDKGNGSDDYLHVVSYDGKLPSSNPDDYITVYLNFSAKNLSYIQDVAVSAYLEDIGKYKENVLFATDSDGILPMLLYNGYKGDGYIILDVYTGNLKDEQIEELIRSVTVKIVNDKEYMGSSEKVLSYENVDSIEIKHYEDE